MVKNAVTYHVHLIRAPGVDVLVCNLADIDIGTQRAHCAASRPIAVDVLNEDIGGWRLDCDALVLVGDHDVVCA